MAVPAPGSLSGVAIYACDVARLCDFYVGVLGLTVVEQDEGYAVLAGAAGEVSVVAIPQEIAQGIVITVPPQMREETPMKPVFVVESLTVAAERARPRAAGRSTCRLPGSFGGCVASTAGIPRATSSSWPSGSTPFLSCASAPLPRRAVRRGCRRALRAGRARRSCAGR